MVLIAATVNRKVHEKVKLWAETKICPFTQKQAARHIGCSQQTVSAALARHFGDSIRWAWKPDGHGNFSRLYFPLHWTRAQCQEYLDAGCKSGKSKAYIGGDK